jgi:hypothetical protein
MFVTVLYNEKWINNLVDFTNVITLEVSDYCPICASERAVIKKKTVVVNGNLYVIDKWNNPCGHNPNNLEIFIEAQELKKLKNIFLS